MQKCIRENLLKTVQANADVYWSIFLVRYCLLIHLTLLVVVSICFVFGFGYSMLVSSSCT